GLHAAELAADRQSGAAGGGREEPHGDGPRRHLGPPRRRVRPLLHRRALAGPSFREDALRPGAVGSGLPAHIPGDRQAGLSRRLREAMFHARGRRVRPERDDKVLTSWNGLMLAAVAEAAAVLGRDDYLAAAQRNADLMLTRLRRNGRLHRTYRDGQARLDGY